VVMGVRGRAALYLRTIDERDRGWSIQLRSETRKLSGTRATRWFLQIWN